MFGRAKTQPNKILSIGVKMQLNKYKITFVLVLVIFLNQFSLQKLKAEAKLNDPAKELLKKMVVATHAEKLKTVKSMYFKCEVTFISTNSSILTGTVDITATRNKHYTKSLFAGKESESGFDGKTSWSKDVTQGSRKLLGQYLGTGIQSIIKDGIITEDGVREYITFYDEILMGPDEKLGEKDCFVLTLKKENNFDKKIFVDKATYLIYVISETPYHLQKNVTLKTFINSYKKLENGFLMADSITKDLEAGTIKLTILEVKIDGAIGDNMFNGPEK